MKSFAVYILFIMHYSSSILSVKISPCAQWNKTGITVAGIRNQSGISSRHLNTARGIFIRQSTNTLYVADTNNNRIQMFTLDQPSMAGITVASTETAPFKIYIDEEENGPVIYVTLRESNRAEKWLDGATSGIQVGNTCFTCMGIAVDKEKNVYMTEYIGNRVTKWSPKMNTTTVVAGGGPVDSLPAEKLLHPVGLHIDKNDGSVYVADSFNNRIQKWVVGAKAGVSVAGSLTASVNDDNQLLNSPNTVLIDEENYMMYIVDNARVQRWFINADEGETIVGRPGPHGELGNPSDMAFDNKGNLYVCDPAYHHIQMFTLIDNRPCSGMTTETTTLKNRATCSNEIRFNWFVLTIISLSISF